MIRKKPSRVEKKFRSVIKLLIEEMKKAISTGKLTPGKRLPEENLASDLHVSRVTLREALRRLEAEGYITFLSSGEVMVSKPAPEDVEDYYTVLGALEGLATRLAVERAGAEEISRLRELHQLLREASKERDLERYFEANSQFHRFIAEIPRNERLYRMIRQIREEIKKTRILLLQLPQRLESSMREHDQIMDAFLKRNAALAETVVAKHLQNQMRALKRIL